MDSTVITKGDILGVVWNSDKEQYERIPIMPLEWLRHPCTVDEGVTLGDIFYAVDKYPELVDFLSCYSDCDVDAFHKEATYPTDPSEDIAYLEIYKYYVIDVNGEFYTNVGFHGCPLEGMERYSFSLTPMNRIVHLPIKLMEKTTLTREFMERPFSETLAEATVTYSLLEVLDAIYWDISFFCSPKDRDDKSEELDKMVDDIESGKAKAVPFDPEEFINA